MTVYNRRKNFTVLFYRLLSVSRTQEESWSGQKGWRDKRRQLSDKLISGERVRDTRDNDTLILDNDDGAADPA